MKCVWLIVLETMFGIYCSRPQSKDKMEDLKYSVCLKEPIIFYFILFIVSVSLIPEYIMYTQVDDI